jgi:hypothetical protein
MAKKTLQIVEGAYRANIEEQDDPVIWITHAIKSAGGDLAVLLRGNATNYAVVGQDARGLNLGGKVHAHPPDVAGEVARLLSKGVPVYVVEDDAAERGLERTDFIPGVQGVGRAALPKLFAGYEQIWHW